MAASIDPTELEIYLQTQRQYSRKELFDRVGAGYAETRNMLAPGVGIPTPLTAAESADRGFVVFQVEFFGGYPNGVLWRNGVQNLEITTAGLLKNNTTGTSAQYDMTADVSADGVHTVGVYSESRGLNLGLTVAFLDGKEVSRTETAGFTDWSAAGGVWEYMNTFTEVGFFSPVLEIFPGYRPAILVG